MTYTSLCFQKIADFFLNHRSWYFSHFHKGELIYFSIFFILHQSSNWHIISFDSVVQMRYFHKFKTKNLGETVDFRGKLTLTVSLTLTLMLLLTNTCLILKPYSFRTYSNILLNQEFP